MDVLLTMQKNAVLRDVQVIVLDELDEMLSRGFKDQIYEVLRSVPKTCQVGLFAAAMPQEAVDIADRFVREPVRSLVAQEELTLEGIKQFYVMVEREEWKLDTLYELCATLKAGSVVVYVNTRRKVDWLVGKLQQKNLAVAHVHGDMGQQQRDFMMGEFQSSSGAPNVLITTDFLARGTDVSQVSAVINYDLPSNAENYIHRIGTSGRAARRGLAISFLIDEDVHAMRHIEQVQNTTVEEMPMNVADLL
eukprot:SAG11_NODE_2920_length_2836_cov_1.899525_1_plen_249_part_00